MVFIVEAEKDMGNALRRLLLPTLVAALSVPLYAQDELTFRRVSDCCYDITVVNRNTAREPINEIAVKCSPFARILTTGSAPSGWVISYLAPTSVLFRAPVSSIQPGSMLSGFRLCFDVPSNEFGLDWITMRSGNPLTMGSAALNCRDTDTLTVRKDPTSADCCHEAILMNRNGTMRSIDRVTMEFVTAGYAFTDAQPPSAAWKVTFESPRRFRLETSQSPLPPGQDLAPFLFCFVPGTSKTDTAAILWTTWDDTTMLTRDTVFLQCLDVRHCDALLVASDVPDSCCYSLAIVNNHSPASKLDQLRLKMISPDAVFTSASGGIWPVSRFQGDEILFDGVSSPLDNGGILAGLRICVTRTVAGSDPVRVMWQTNRFGKPVCWDTVFFDCGATAGRCDLVTAQKTGACCHGLSLRNTHTPEGPLDGFRVRVLTPGAVITGTPTGPWSLQSATSTEAVFHAAAPLGHNRTAEQFLFCFRLPGDVPGVVTIAWQTLNGAATVCTDTLVLECLPDIGRTCDSLFHSLVRDCDFRFGFRNTHSPAGTVNGFRIQTLTGGARLGNAVTPAAWSIRSQTDQAVVWESNAGASPGVLVDGFGLTVTSVFPGSPVLLQRCTVQDGTDICCDTVIVTCTVQTRCDSLFTREGSGGCAFELGFVNLHSPQSPVKGFRVSILTPGARIASATPPNGWVLISLSAGTALFSDTAGSVPVNGRQDGFMLTFEQAAGNPTVAFQWCSMDGPLTICCDNASVTCRTTQQRGDSLILRPTAESCTFNAGFGNSHIPASVVDGFSVLVATTGASFARVQPPPGWRVLVSEAQRVVFGSAGPGVPPGDSLTGFTLSLNPALAGSTIRLFWCTMQGSVPLTCDTIIVECETSAPVPDSMAVIADPERPCCREFRLFNKHTPSSSINRLEVAVITPDVFFFPSRIEGPQGWKIEHEGDTLARWSTVSIGLTYGSTLSGCVLCFDNNRTGNQPFDIHWRAFSAQAVTSADTVRIDCDATLPVSPSPSQPPVPTLHRNYPNPVSDRTSIGFDIPREGFVRLVLLDATGREIRTILEGSRAAGSYRVEIDAAGLPPGVIFYRLESGNLRCTRAMIVLR
ncbi:MAG: hypothetical protein QHI48_04010 [Bacteroidota bacterium]|nr:hypothetical protein [Bacteroidota bacterium]